MEELINRLIQRTGRKIAYAESSSAWMAAAFRQLQSLMFSFFVSRYLDEIFQGGRLELSVRSSINAARVSTLVESEYKNQARGLFARIAARMLRLFRYNTEYFQLLGLPETEAALALRRVMLSYGYDVATGQPIPGGYLEGVLNSPGMAQFVGRQIQEGMAAGMSKREFLAKFRAAFVNPGGSGMLERHFRRFAQDFFQQHDRLSSSVLAEATGLTYFMYAGTAVDDSRKFCLQRLNRVYTTYAAEKWNNLEWQGKIPNVPVMQQLGGYNCRHTPMFISEELAKAMEGEYGKINGYNVAKTQVRI